MIENINPLAQGYTARGARMDDIEISVRLMNEYSQYYLGEDEAPPDVIRNEWESPGFNPATDIRLVFSKGGTAVGYVEVWTTSDPPVHPWVWWCVHPEHLGNGIGDYLLNWAEGRARQAIPKCPPETRVAYRSGAHIALIPSKKVMEAHGMVLIRHSFHMLIEMESPPPKPIWPEGITLGVYHPDHIDPADIYRANVEAFRDHFGFIEQPFKEGFERFMHFMTGDESYDPNLWFLAMDGDQIVGICLNRKTSFESPDVGWVSTLGVLRPWRRRGIALGLLRHSFGEFYHRGKRKVALGVDAENLTGALDLYKKTGMHIHRQFDLYEKELRPGVELGVVTLEE
ncbi:MAG: GNAT family N-acetyltransferase [Chloroflexota bacterium]